MPHAGNPLFIHVDENDVVWYGDGSTFAKNTKARSHEFRLGALWNYSSIGLLSHRRNAEVIVNLFDQQVRHAGPSVILHSPAPLTQRQHDPVTVLHYLRHPSAPSQRGIHHPITMADVSTFALITELKKSSGEITPAVLSRGRDHPVCPGVDFISDVNYAAVCLVLAQIVDPRSYVDPMRPGRIGRIYSRLGLTLDNAAAFMSGHDGRWNYSNACAAFNLWYTFSGGLFITRPGEFLWKEFSRVGGGPRGLLRATQKAISLVVRFWITTYNLDHPEVGFDPERFFGDDATASAFRKHVEEWSAV